MHARHIDPPRLSEAIFSEEAGALMHSRRALGSANQAPVARRHRRDGSELSLRPGGLSLASEKVLTWGLS